VTVEKITVQDVAQTAAWLVERGCKAAPVQAPSHSGVVYTQPDSQIACFAQSGDVLVWNGKCIAPESAK
jgi:hypothetical protein